MNFIPENAFENVICKMAAILSRPQYVNSFLSETEMAPILIMERMLWNKSISVL